MNDEVQAKWTEDLESGNFKQGKNCLGKRNPDGTVEFCCLGVLEEQAVAAGIVTRDVLTGGTFVYTDVELTESNIDDEYYNSSSSSTLTEATQRWAGLDSLNPVAQHSKTLAELNDEGVPFPKIARVIKEGL